MSRDEGGAGSWRDRRGRPAEGRAARGAGERGAGERGAGERGAGERSAGGRGAGGRGAEDGGEARPRRARGGEARPADAGPRVPLRPKPTRSGLKKPPLVPQVTTLWDYPSQHYGDRIQGDQNYRGATPSYVIWNVLHRYTTPGEVVLDPFCGSGTTLDVAADLGRDAIGFDLAPHRADVRHADARKLPLDRSSVDLVFMDPPYADNLAYSDDPRCIGKLRADGAYQRAMAQVLSEAARVLRPDRVLAIYVADVLHKERAFYPLGFELFQLALERFVPLDVVAVVRHNRTLEMGNYRQAADEGGYYLRGFNYLLLFRRA